MQYYLIDYENFSDDMIMNSKDFANGASVYLFYSDMGGKKISLDAMTKIQGGNRKVQNIKVHSGTKNALDFQLTSYLGYLIAKAGKKDEFFIVANDKGYDVVARFWHDQGVKVSRIEYKEPEKNTSTRKEKTAAKSTSAKTTKVEAKDIATQGEVQKILGKGYNFQAITEIVNQYKTKSSINSALIKFANKDTKKAGEIYQKLKPLLKEKHKT